MSARKPFILGLTGSIGMGKSTTADFFRELGIPVWDADAAVHRLYSKGGAAVEPIGTLCPPAARDSAIDRTRLKEWIAQDDTALKQIEAVVHPLLARDREAFIQQSLAQRQKLVVIDVPLLFEIGGDAHVDAILVVSAPADVQKKRVLAREGMTKTHFKKILALQMPDAEKRKKADFIVETTTLESAKKTVKSVINDIMNRIDANA